jgi:hypothetical protein
MDMRREVGLRVITKTSMTSIILQHDKILVTIHISITLPQQGPTRPEKPGGLTLIHIPSINLMGTTIIKVFIIPANDHVGSYRELSPTWSPLKIFNLVGADLSIVVFHTVHSNI